MTVVSSRRRLPEWFLSRDELLRLTKLTLSDSDERADPGDERMGDHEPLSVLLSVR